MILIALLICVRFFWTIRFRFAHKSFFRLYNNSLKKQSNNTSTSIVKTEIAKSKLEEAKEVAKTILEYVEQIASHQITKEQLDIKAKPFRLITIGFNY